jgi:hypothetical protein
MQEWRRFVGQLRARTRDKVLLWSVDFADALVGRMATLPDDRAIAVAGIVYRGMAEALRVDPVGLFELLAEAGYMGDTRVNIIHVADTDCECERCREVAVDEMDPKEMN